MAKWEIKNVNIAGVSMAVPEHTVKTAVEPVLKYMMFRVSLAVHMNMEFSIYQAVIIR